MTVLYLLQFCSSFRMFVYTIFSEILITNFKSIRVKRYEKSFKMQLCSLCRKMYGVSVA